MIDIPGANHLPKAPAARTRWLEAILAVPWQVWLSAANLFFLIFTVTNQYLPESVQNGWIHHFNLSIEMNLAAWWSSALLLAAALHMYERASDEREQNRLAWLVLTLVAAGLSLDEIGSLHERVGSLRALLPAMVIIALLVAFGLLRLFADPASRRLSLLLFLGFGLLATVALQEKIEHLVHWPEWARGIRAGLEEGTELLGMSIILGGLVQYRYRGKAPRGLLPAVPDPKRFLGWLPALGAILALHTAVSFPLAQGYAPSKLGNPVVWFPMAVFFILACRAAWKLQPGSGKKRLWWIVLAGFFLLNSAGVVYLNSPRSDESRVSESWYFNYFFLQALLWVALLGLSWAADRQIARRGLPLFALAALAIGAGVAAGGLAAQWIVAGVTGFLMAVLFLGKKDQGESGDGRGKLPDHDWSG